MLRIPTHRIPTHPGEMLLEEFLIPMALTQRDLAEAIRVPYQRINEIVNGKRGITPSTALRLARYFENSEGFWMNLQLRWDLYHARAAEESILARIRPRVAYVSVDQIERIDPQYAHKLREAGIVSTRSLLDTAGHPEGRKHLAEQTGLSDTLILQWVNLSDLMRIKGIGEEYSDLLNEAGVDTLDDLRMSDPVKLLEAITEVNTREKLVRRLPSLSEVRRWASQAKRIASIVVY